MIKVLITPTIQNILDLTMQHKVLTLCIEEYYIENNYLCFSSSRVKDKKALQAFINSGEAILF